MEHYNKRYAEYTSYPRIFLGAYWGTHKRRQTPSLTDTEKFTIICDNRNEFKNNYFITKYYELPKRRGRERLEKNSEVIDDNGRDIRDHKEYYKCEDGTIISVFSNYVGTDEKKHNLILSKGYTIFKHMYSEDQNTYIKII